MSPSKDPPTSVFPGALKHRESISPTSRSVLSPGNASTAPSSDAPAVKRPASPLQLPAEAVQNVRRPSIQIRAHSVMTGEPKAKKSAITRRMSSPPPPPLFRPRITFDTFEKVDKRDEAGSEPPSFTLNQKHKDYEYNKRSRTFLCGLDSNSYSEYALEWLIDELVDDGDEVVCLRVIDPESAKASLGKLEYRDEAEVIMKQIEEKNHEKKAINLILEFSIGKVEKVIRRMIEFYEPSILIVGTRGKSLGGFQGLLPGSISKFCLQNSPVPVIVVRPNTQRARGKRKRLQDPGRHAYRDLLAGAGIEGHLLDSSNYGSVDNLGGIEEERHASSNESAAVAAAVGIKLDKLERGARGSPLVKVESAGTNISESEPELSPDGEGARLMKSPEMQNLESPELSGESAFGDDDTDGPSSPDFFTPRASMINPVSGGKTPLDEGALADASNGKNAEELPTPQSKPAADTEADAEAKAEAGGVDLAENANLATTAAQVG